MRYSLNFDVALIFKILLFGENLKTNLQARAVTQEKQPI